MNRSFILVTVLLFVFLYNGKAQTPDSVLKYIDSAVYIMQSKSLYGNNVNWELILDSAHLRAKHAKNYKEAFPAIAFAFAKLKDYHGMVAGPDTFYRFPTPINFEDVLSAGIKKEFLKGNRIVTASIDKIAYLRIPSMNVTKQADMNLRANMLRDSLCQLIATDPQALILDLRMNGGGNSAPMVSGIGPVFQTKVLGYGVDRNNKILKAVKLQHGILVDENGKKMVTVRNTCKVSRSLLIAVLIGPSTVSSGEILAAYLRQQPNVKLFGEPTPGFCNATEGFLFMNNQGYLLLTVNKIADARKQVYDEMLVKPHVYVKSRDNYENLPEDPTLQAALAWINKGIGK